MKYFAARNDLICPKKETEVDCYLSPPAEGFEGRSSILGRRAEARPRHAAAHNLIGHFVLRRRQRCGFRRSEVKGTLAQLYDFAEAFEVSGMF